MVKVAPVPVPVPVPVLGPSLSAEMRPLEASTRAWAMVSPIPLPARAVVREGSAR